MRRVKLFIATSLDGYIARKDGGIDWLFTDGDYGYADFYASIDTTLTGRKTYELILTFGDFPYPGKTNYIFSRAGSWGSAEQVTFVDEDVAAFVERLKKQEGRDIWLVGGAEIVSALERAGLIDDYIISVHPIILGDGISLFSDAGLNQSIELVSTGSFPSGLVQLTYRRIER
ncbi:MAG: dihydrofolate reductase [Bacteroidetes bacterium]|nr:dihydrofolate reductase [Bacteroidota bacterium]